MSEDSNSSKILSDFVYANEYFDDNFIRANKKYQLKVAEFNELYNKIARNQTGKLTAKQGTAIAILYRALKLTFSSFDLTLRGHAQEARIIQRNIQESRLVYLDIALNDDAYELWALAQEAKSAIKKDNIIPFEPLKEKIIENLGGQSLAAMKVNASIKRLKRHNQNEYVSKALKDIVDMRNLTSEFISHENIFNLVRRIDVVKLEAEKERTETYIGVDADSDMAFYLDPAIDILRELKADMDFILSPDPHA